MVISSAQEEFDGVIYKILLKKDLKNKREYDLFRENLLVGDLILSLKNKSVIITLISLIKYGNYAHLGYGQKFIQILEKIVKAEGYNEIVATDASGLENFYIKHCDFKQIDNETFLKKID